MLPEPMRTFVLSLLLALVIALPVAAAASDQYLTVTEGIIVLADRPGVNLDRPLYLAGSDATLLVVVREADGTSARLRPNESLTATIGQALTFIVTTEDSVQHPDWLPVMNFRVYVDRQRSLADSLHRTSGEPIPDYLLTREYNSVFTIPPDAAGRTLLISAVVRESGRAIRSLHAVVFPVVASASDADADRIMESRLLCAYYASDNLRTLSLTDSCIQLGYRGLLGLTTAERAAVELNRYADALRYLDLCMAANGEFRIVKGRDLGPSVHQPPQNAEAVRQREAANQAAYERKRAEYLQRIADQESKSK
jgi:hypothetical protein